MKIQINSNHSIPTPEGFAERIRDAIEHRLQYNKSQLTRVEVFLSDANGGKSGIGEKHCALEARLAGRSPIAVTDQAETIDAAIDGAALKLNHALQTILDKEHAYHPR
jgi:ribosome-associated translation inhibitor RaiA